MTNLTAKLQQLPATPGVYLMKDARGLLLYVGKAKNLKRRVSSYFHSSGSHSPKVQKLVKHLKDIEILPTDTEFEAFLLECRMIQELKPPYNRMMKNPQRYAYIRFRIQHGLLRADAITAQDHRAGDRCFGPYPSQHRTLEAVQGLQAWIGVLCSSPTAGRNALCLNASLGLCTGACGGGQNEADAHNRGMLRILGLLDGTDPSLLDELHRRMLEASDRMDFEEAAKLRNLQQAVQSLLRRERIIGFAEGHSDFAVVESVSESAIKLFLIRRSQVLLQEVFHLDANGSLAKLVTLIATRIQDTFRGEAPAHTLEVRPDEIDRTHIIYNYLQKSLNRSLLIPPDWLVPGRRVSPDLRIAVRGLIQDAATRPFEQEA